MELFSWLKLKIKNLSLTFFSFRYKREINIINYYFFLNLPDNQQNISKLSKPQSNNDISNRIEIELNQTQQFLVDKINTVHKINGKNYDFSNDYIWALYYIKTKPDEGWPYNAALRIAQAMQDIDFFGAFEEIDNLEKQDVFNDIKNKLNYIYNRIIQELRHTNKRNQIEKQFKAPYHNILHKEPELKDSDYEDIFNEFQNLLIQLFLNFKLKDI